MILSKLTVFTAWLVLITPVLSVLLIWWYKRTFPSMYEVNDCVLTSTQDANYLNNTYYCKVPQAYISLNLLVSPPLDSDQNSSVPLVLNSQPNSDVLGNNSNLDFLFTMETSVHIFLSESEKATTTTHHKSLSEEHTISNIMSYPYSYKSSFPVAKHPSSGAKSSPGGEGADSLHGHHYHKKSKTSKNQRRSYTVPIGPVVDLFALSYSSWLPYFVLDPPHPHPRTTSYGTEQALVWNTSAFGSHSFETEIFPVVEVRTSQLLVVGTTPATLRVQVLCDDPLLEEVLCSFVLSIATVGCLVWFCVVIYQRGLQGFADSVTRTGVPVASEELTPLTERSMLVAPSIRGVSGRDTAWAVLFHTEPEQLFGALLLAFLVLYQGGLGNIHLLTTHEFHVGGFWSRMLVLMGLQGLWMSAVLIADSLQFCPTNKFSSPLRPSGGATVADRGVLTTPERNYGSAYTGPTGVGDGETPLSRTSTNTNTPLSDYPEYLSFRGHGFDEEETEEPLQHSHLGAFYCDCSVPNLRHNAHIAWQYCVGTLQKWYRRLVRCFNTDAATVGTLDYESLRPSHPLSPRFREFASPKLVYFLVCCGVVVVNLFVKSLALYCASSTEGVRSSVTMTDINTDSDGYWGFLSNSEHNSSLLLDQDKPWNEQFLANLNRPSRGGESSWERMWHEDLRVFVTLLDGACSLALLASQLWWGYALTFSCAATAQSLRTKRFMMSRFNQLYFRLLSVQTLTAAIGVAVASLFVVYSVTKDYWKLADSSNRLVFLGEGGAEGAEEAVFSVLTVLELSWIALWTMLNSLWEHPNRLSTMVYISLLCIATVWLVSPSDAASRCLGGLGLHRGGVHHQKDHYSTTHPGSRVASIPLFLITEAEVENLLVRTQAQPTSVASAPTDATRFQQTHRSQLRSLFRKYLSRQRYMKDSRVLLHSARSGHHHHHDHNSHGSARDTEPFCLEMACKLLECSTQAYSLAVGETIHSSTTEDAVAGKVTNPDGIAPTAVEVETEVESEPLLSDSSVASSSYFTPATSQQPGQFSPQIGRQGKEIIDSVIVTPPGAVPNSTVSGDSSQTPMAQQTPATKSSHLILDPLNLRMRDHFENASTSVGGFVAVSSPPPASVAHPVPSTGTGSAAGKSELIVVCFRGTATHANLITDLAFQQTPLPNLALSKSYFEDVVTQLETKRGPATYNVSSTQPKRTTAAPGPGLVRNPSMRYSSSKRRSERFQALLQKDSSRRESEYSQMLGPESTSADPARKFSFSLDNADDADGGGEEAELDAISVTSSHSSSQGSSDVADDISYYYDSGSGEEEPEDDIDDASLIEDGGGGGGLSVRGRGRAAADFDAAAELSACWCFSWRCLQWCASSLPWLCREFNPRVHSGFWAAYISIRNDVMRSVTAVLLRRYTRGDTDGVLGRSAFGTGTPPLLRVYCTGHSLGGALATFASMDLSINMYAIITTVIKAVNRAKVTTSAATKSRGSVCEVAHYAVIKEPLITVYSFGSPRMGNGPFASLVSHCLNPRMSASSTENKHSHTNNYRVVMDGDLVPMVPKQLLCAQTIGNWKHCGTPILLDHDAKGNMVINPSVLEIQMLRSHNAGKVSLHQLAVYRNSLQACFGPAAQLQHQLSGSKDNEGDFAVMV